MRTETGDQASSCPADSISQNESSLGEKIIGLAYRLGTIHGMHQFAWMKDGVYYVGTCGTTLRYAVENFEKMSYSEENELMEVLKSKVPNEIVRWLEERLKKYQYS